MVFNSTFNDISAINYPQNITILIAAYRKLYLNPFITRIKIIVVAS
jgi:hypothetical protein